MKGTFYRAYLRAIFTVADNAMPRLRRSGGGPSWREKARKVDYTGKLHLFTRRDIRANLPLNAALRAVLTFKTLSVGFIYLRARDCQRTNKYN